MPPAEKPARLTAPGSQQSDLFRASREWALRLRAVQKLLGHESIQTTGDIYTDWDIDQLAETMRGVLNDAD